MKAYKNYQLEDFIIDEDFIQWVKYPTEESEAFWQAFMENEPAQAATVRKARYAVQQLALVSRQNAPNGEIPIIWTDIEGDLNAQNKRIFSSVQLDWRAWIAAASLLLAMGFSYYWWNIKAGSSPKSEYSRLVSETQSTLKELVNTTSTNLTVSMPDGSKAILKPNSRLSYNESFAGLIREVYLSGEAFFDVRKNPGKPFLVYANGLTIKVLGTSFEVKAYEKDKQVTVMVKTGRVSVFAHQVTKNQDPETKGLVLTSNQKAIFGKEDEHLSRTLVERPTLLLSSRELEQFSFTNAPISQIFAALEKAYGVDIVFDEEVMTNCFLTTSLTNETLFEKLDIICEGLESTYKVVDAQVIISSKGCN